MTGGAGSASAVAVEVEPLGVANWKVEVGKDGGCLSWLLKCLPVSDGART